MNKYLAMHVSNLTSFTVVYGTEIASGVSMGTAIWSIEDFQVINTQLSHLVAGYRVAAHSGLKAQWVELIVKTGPERCPHSSNGRTEDISMEDIFIKTLSNQECWVELVK